MDNQPVWDQHYKRPRALQTYPDENVVRVLKKTFPAKEPGSLCLDLGAGSGRHLPLLAEHMARVVACDFSRESLKAYKGIQAALPYLPFVENVFDFVLCWGVLHYLPAAQIPAAVAEIRRILKPQGRLFLTLRSDSDTHLKAQLDAGDLKDGHAELFSKQAALAFFKDFGALSYGFILRQPLGEEHQVAHHMILATR